MAERRVHRKPLRVNNRAILQDARQAMGNDIINALVELITNADDSYTWMEAPGISEIRVGVDRRKREVWVDDDAQGMTYEQLDKGLGGLGERTSGISDNDNIRGFFGRGAKDVAALGDVTWITTRDGWQSQLTISFSGDEEDTVTIEEQIPDDSGRHGTTVWLKLQSGVRLPKNENLVKLLSRHFALIPILTDRSRRLVLMEGDSFQTITYKMPTGECWLDAVRFPLPGYPNESIEVTLYEAPEPLDETESGRVGQSQYWRHSLLVMSGRAAYEFWPGGAFAKRQPESTYLRRFFGRVDVPLINRLLKESDIITGGEEIVSRNRHGLARGSEHRLSAALDDAIEEALKPHMERLKQQSLRANTDQTTPENKRMLRDLAGVVNDYVREVTEVDPPGPGPDPGPDLKGLRLIPQTRHVEPMRPARMTIRYEPKDGAAQDLVATITVADEVNSHSTDTLPLVSHGHYSSATYRLPGQVADSVIELMAEVSGEQAKGLVLWQEDAPPTITELRFERKSYTMKPESARVVRLLAPAEYQDRVPAVGFVSETPLRLERIDRSLQWNNERECCVYAVRVTGGEEDLKSTLRAEVDDTEAFAEVRTRLPGLAGMEIKLSEEYADATERVWYNAEASLLIVNAKHPEVSRFLGSYEEGRPGQDDLEFRTMLRELVCHAVVSYTLQEAQSELRDVGQILGAYEREYEKLIARTRDILVPRTKRE